MYTYTRYEYPIGAGFPRMGPIMADEKEELSRGTVSFSNVSAG